MQPMSAKLEETLTGDAALVASSALEWERFSGCRVVVTGVTGFLGGAIARALLALHPLGKVSQPVRVVALVRDLTKARQQLDQFRHSAELELVHWDLSSIAVPDLGQVHYVIHAASQASPRFYNRDPVGTLLPNSVGTAGLLRVLQNSTDPRGFLFVSSGDVYGAVSGVDRLKETDYGVVEPMSVHSCYAESKRLGETMCVAWHHQFGVPTFVVRPFHTYGPGLTPEDGRVFADFVFNVVRGENIVMKSDGSARRAFCYSSDAVSGIFRVLLNGQVATPYNVANPEGELSVLDLAELLVGLFPERRLQVERQPRTASADYLQSPYSRMIPDVSRLKALGWKAAVPPAQGFKRMVEAYL